MAKSDEFVTRTPALSRGAPIFAFHQLASLVRAVDAVAIAVPAILIYVAYGLPVRSEYFLQYLVSILVAVIVALLSLQRFGTYDDAHFFDGRFQFRRIIGALGFAAAILLALVAALKITDLYSRVWATLWFVSSICTVTLSRSLFRRWVSRLADAGRFALRTVIVGSGKRSSDLDGYFEREDRRSVHVVDIVDDRDDEISPAHPKNGQDGIDTGGLSGLLQMIRRGMVDQVVIAIPWQEHDRIRRVVNALAVTPVDIRLAPDLIPPEFRSRHYVEVAGMPMLGVFDRPMSGWSQVIKAVEDRVLAVAFLILLALPMAAIWLGIKLDSPGPALFRQQRKGFNDNLIEVWKFRTMREHEEGPDGIVQAVRGDSRVTGVGRFLRRTSLDELPQLFNVLRGEMSIVGPRPHVVALRAKGYLFEDIVDQYAARHRVKPGITGWAQVNGWRGETDTIEKAQKRVEYDLDYIDNWSIWLDVLIILKTVVILFRDKKAY